MNPMIQQLIVQPCRHLSIERGHHLGHRLDEADHHSSPPQLLGHFEPDEPAADNHSIPSAVFVDPGEDVIHIGHVAHGKMSGAADAGDGRDKRPGAR